MLTAPLMAASLSEQFASDDKRSALIDDALRVLDAEVADKSGLSGIAVKTAFKVIQGVQPGFLKKVVKALLPDFLEKMDPLYQDALSAGKSPGGLLVERKREVAGALLSVTDAKAAGARDLVRKTYDKLRPSAEKHVESAAPRLAGLLDRHAAKA